MLGLILGASDPNNIVIRITSYIPFLSSYIMPIRLANETVGMGGALISLLVLVAVTILIDDLVCKHVSNRMYSFIAKADYGVH